MRTKQLQCFLTAVLVLLLFSFAAQGKGRPFITRWKGAAGKELYIPIKGENYKLVIKKADGTVLKTETSLTITDYGFYKYTPSQDGELLIEAGPEGVTAIEFDTNHKSAKALLCVEQFGTVQWQTMQYAFYGCKNMQFASGIDTPDLSKVTNMQSMFSGCALFNQPLNNWDASQVTSMSGMFSGCASFNQPLNNWNVSKVTDMSGMFGGCTSFNQSLNSWDVSKVTNMRAMFDGCASFNQPLNSWDVSKVTDMAYMFSYCSSFNQNLGMWKLEKCEDLDLDNCGMSEENYSKSLVGWASQANIKQGLYLSARGLKYNASGKAARKKLIESKKWSISDVVDENDRPFITRWKGEVGKVLQIPIRGKNFKLVIKMSDGTVLKTETSLTGSYRYIPTKSGELIVEAGPEGVRSFSCWYASAEALLRVEQFGTVQWQTMRNAFYGCKNMQFASGIDTPDLSKVTNMQAMFSRCTSFNQPLNNWDVSKVTDMSYMFSGCTSFNQPLNNWDVSKVTNMNDMFSGCTSFNQPLNSWDVSKVTRMGGMFSGCTSFNQPLNNWDVSKVTYMGWMFYGCTSFNQPLNSWDVSKVTDMGRMFDGCTSFNQPLNSWDVSKVTYMRDMFSYCTSFNQPLNNWDVSQVTNMKTMFYGCTSFNQPLNSWDVSKVTSMDAMYYGCTSFNQPLNSWDVSKVTGMNQMFRGCTSFNQPLNNWDVSKVTSMGLMYYGCTSFNQPLNSWDVSKVTDMSSMFSGCTSFNQPLNRWDVSKVTDMRRMFSGCTSFNQNLGMWKLEANLDLSNCGMSAENYGKSLEGWAAQTNIRSRVELEAAGLKYFPEATESRKKLINKESWSIIGDVLLPYYISFETGALTLTKGEEHTLVLTKKGFDASETVVLTSSDPYTVQIIDAASLTIKGLKAGKATITATVAANGEHSAMKATCEVFVTVPATGVTLSETELILRKGATAKLTATVLPTDATNKKVRWSSNNTAVAIVESGTVAALSAGNATITVTTEDGNHTARCEVVVTDPVPVTGVTLSQTELPLVKGATATLTATVAPSDATNKKVRWSSNNTAVAIVENGTVTAVSGGAATITVTTEDGNHTATCEVLVTVPVTGVTLLQTELPLAKGATATLTATVLPSDATNQKVRRSSNNTSVATVENGTVTAVSGGTATITVTTEDGNHTARCEVTVTVSATGVTLSQTELSLVKGATATLTATVLPSDATNQKVTWSSTNTAVATVENGTVTAVSVGNATITVTTEDGNYTATCEVTVTVSATGVTLSQTELPLAKGATATLSATVVPADATNKKVTWRSNNTSIATVENGTVTAVSGGNATITVTTEDGNHTARCEVVVTAPVPAASVTLSQTELILRKGATAKLTATVLPTDATNKKVRWSSNNTAVAIVESGTVAALSAGNATITVTTEDGNHTATCSVTVEATSAVEDVVFASVVVSPNPFGEQLCITYVDLRGQYVLYNAQGVVVASGSLEDGETRINTVSFTAGVYLLRLTAENGATKNYTVVKD